MPIKLPSFRPRRDAYPPDLWTKCPSCGEMLFNKQLDKVLRVCPSCGHHFRLSAEARIAMLVDHGSFSERDAGLESEDPLGFVDQKTYPDRVVAAQLATGMRDAAVWGTAAIDGRHVVICVMDFGFMGGSMGAVVGEKVTRAAEHALTSRVPLFIASASGGARMQEGTFSLMQLAKTVGAIERLRAAGVPFLSLLSDPTTGGVFASFAVLGDVNLAEPNALIGFAGARVSAGTIAQELPPGFQRSEFLFQHGFLDRVVHRSELRSEVSTLLRYLVAGPSPSGAAERVEGDPLGLPSFRPLSFLSNLAERVLPTEADMAGATNGHTPIPAPAAAPPSVAQAPAEPEPPEADPVASDSVSESPTPEAVVAEEVPSEPASQLTAEPATEPVMSESAASEPASGSSTEETPRG
jgi:acetyl-CoA carboxylase carboxyl transferase subunit beta